jgi:hypothetical protein
MTAIECTHGGPRDGDTLNLANDLDRAFVCGDGRVYTVPALGQVPPGVSVLGMYYRVIPSAAARWYPF